MTCKAWRLQEGVIASKPRLALVKVDVLKPVDEQHTVRSIIRPSHDFAAVTTSPDGGPEASPDTRKRPGQKAGAAAGSSDRCDWRCSSASNESAAGCTAGGCFAHGWAAVPACVSAAAASPLPVCASWAKQVLKSVAGACVAVTPACCLDAGFAEDTGAQREAPSVVPLVRCSEHASCCGGVAALLKGCRSCWASREIGAAASAAGVAPAERLASTLAVLQH